MTNKFKMYAVMLGLAVAFLAGPAVAAESDTSYSFSGYVKTDVIYNPGFDGGETFYVYSPDFPTGPDDADPSVGFTARQSRIRFDSQTKTALGPLSTRIETDFYDSTGDKVLRLRHAYGQLGPVLVGQSWSILGDEDTYADTVDFDGPIGVASRRAPQIRYTLALGKSLTGQVAMEEANSSSRVPNFLGALRFRPSWGAINLSGVVREARDEEDNLFVYGLHAGAHVNVMTGRTRLLATLNFGSGVASYMLGTSDATTSINGELEGQDMMGGLAGITHSWTDSVRSGLYYGWVDRDDKDGTKERLQTFHANVFVNPVPQITVGLEYIHGRRDLSGENGDASRWQIGVQYNF